MWHVPRSILCAAVAGVLCLSAPLSGAQASIWTQLPTGTNESISSIAYVAPGDIVFATTAGAVLYETPSGFVPAFGTGGVLTAIAFAPGSTSHGVVAGESGKLYYTEDGGQIWTAAGSPATIDNADCGTSPNPGQPLSGINLYSVRYSSATTVWAVGDAGVILKSTDGGKNFAEINHGESGGVETCKVPYEQALTDSAWSNASEGFFIDNDFGQVFRTSDGLTTALGSGVSATNGFTAIPQLALDAASPNLLWAVNPEEANSSFQVRSTNGGATWSSPKYFAANGEASTFGPLATQWTVADMDGTTLMAGDKGTIYSSVDGENFYEYPASDGDTSSQWRAVALLNPTAAAVGGVGGKLFVTNQANAGPPAPVTPVTPVTPIVTPAPIVVKPVPVNPHIESSFTVGKDVVTLQTPSGCVRAGRVTARLEVASRKRKGKVVLKVGKVIFKVDNKSKQIKTHKPFAATFHLQLQPGSTHTLSAQVFIKVHHAPPRHKTLRNTFKACT